MHNYNKLHYIALKIFVLTHILGVNTLAIYLKYIVTQKVGIRYPIFYPSEVCFWPINRIPAAIVRINAQTVVSLDVK
jgi:hypothetical protein